MSLRRRVAGPLVAVGAGLLCLGLLELILELFFPVPFLRPPDNDLLSLHLHQAGSVPDLPFELKPGSQLKSLSSNVTYRINSQGMRDVERDPKKPKETLRVAAVGDSWTFGWRVPFESIYPRVLEGLLSKDLAPASKVEVLNFGVCGYSTLDERAVIEHKVLAWEPDVIVLGYLPNDPEYLPIGTVCAYYHKPPWWERTNLFRLALSARRNLELSQVHDDYQIFLHQPEGRAWQGVLRSFEAIHELAAARGTPVVLAVFPGFPSRWDRYPYPGILAQVTRAGQEAGFQVLDVMPYLATLPPEKTRLSEVDGHPNALGHELIARALREALLPLLKRIGNGV